MTAKRINYLTIFSTFLLVLLGGYVHNTESSLACPDWPLCYGQFFPKMEGGVLIEHSHRLLASFVGFLTVILFSIYARKRKEEKFLFQVSLAALVMVIVQGLLGGITVIYKLPTIVSTSHLSLAMIYFCTLIFIKNKQRDKNFLKDSNPIEVKKNWNPNIKTYTFLGFILIYLQIVLGAFMRHSGAGAACGLGPKNSLLCLGKDWNLTWWPELASAQLHMAHRYMAVFLVFFVLLISFKLIQAARSLNSSSKIKKTIFRNVAYINLIILTQVSFGIATVAYGITPLPTTLHLGFGALLLAFVWNLYLNIKEIEKNINNGKYLPSFLGDLLNLTKPKLSGLVIVTATIGMILAPSEINFFKGAAIIVLIGMVVGGACVLNCYMERDIDLLMERTKTRPLPSNRLSPTLAKIYGVSLTGIGLIGLFSLANFYTGFLGIIAAVVYLYIYTPLKKLSFLALFIGAIPGAIPPLMGWVAVTNSFDQMALILFGILFVWQLPHFLAIAIYNSSDYKMADIKTYFNLKGLESTKNSIVIYTLLLVAVSLLPALLGDVSKGYFISTSALGILFVLLSFYGLSLGSNMAINSVWAKRYFKASIFYLPVVLGIMIFLM